MSEPDLKWNKCDLSTAQQLLNNTAFPGQVFPLPLNDLPAGVQKMPGLSKAFISGFLEPKVAALDITGVAEFVAVRYDGPPARATISDSALHRTEAFSSLAPSAISVAIIFNREKQFRWRAYSTAQT